MLFRRRVNQHSDVDVRWFDTEVARCRRFERPLTVITISTPDNEDAPLLRSVASEVRKSDYVLDNSRTNEVVVIAPETTPENLAHLADRVGAHTSVVWGTATFPEDGTNLSTLVGAARSRQVDSSTLRTVGQ